MDLSRHLCGQLFVCLYRGVVEALNEAVLMKTSVMDYFLKDLNQSFPAVLISGALILRHLDLDSQARLLLILLNSAVNKVKHLIQSRD